MCLGHVSIGWNNSLSEALSARVIAGGEGGDPRLRGEGEVGHFCLFAHRFIDDDHLTLPSLCDGPHPLPRKRGGEGA